MRYQWTACMVAGAVAWGLAPTGTQAQTALPSATLRLHCFDNGADTTAAEAEGIMDLLAFAEAHDGEVVYLDAVIEADAGAGLCSRDLSEFPDQPWPEPGRARITIDPCRTAISEGEEGRHCWRDGMVDVQASGPPMARASTIVLPAQTDIPENLPYRIGGYGDWLNVQGPFVVHRYSGTGYDYATFHVPDAALPGVWERARLNAEVWKQGQAER
ncbi:hypothetical protein GCM10009116_02860 [Brevundimonas basaltis]|uniref:Uncharacterized protein n=1 Tax=Brevundimonas basaltis TaxID=472166 RepID=A0A7W8MHD7_9CAUL|nr:hypothetical protein [Brevundimonas basaltis]MBB5292559.1 hypothetical protein [Brevundimonas basaltis]